ncbi:MAG: hypothetical protein JNL05_10585 [Flavobacteriales bacterium]|nr:hypothetical protein [Flavobacteriales bacterium]
MNARIVFPARDGRGQVELRKVSAVEVKTSVHDVCQRATVTLPRNVSALQQDQLKSFIKRGDRVQVYLGYDGDLQLEFDGYVERVAQDVPVVLELRDRLWKLLQQPCNKAYRDAYLPTLVSDLVGDAFTVDAMEANIGPVRFEQATKAQAFKALKDEFGLVTYLRAGTVYCGKLFAADAPEVAYDVERNVVSTDLSYKVADDVKVKVTAKSIQRNGGEPITVEVGDPEGEARTQTYYGITSKAELKKLAEADLEKYRYDGYEGGFKAFGVPVCHFGYKVALSSTLYPERDGHYLAEGVEVSFGTGGFRRNIKLAQAWTR